jgi:hypothetical protein
MQDQLVAQLVLPYAMLIMEMPHQFVVFALLQQERKSYFLLSFRFS